jgi:hypothetical protein
LTQSLGNFTVQGSMAFIHAPEPDEHGNVVRTTVSLHHNRPTENGNIGTTLVYGTNAGHHGTRLHSFLREVAYEGSRMAVWGRLESLQRVGAELELPLANAETRYWVSAFTLGTGVTVAKAMGLDFFIGGQGALNFGVSKLEPYYGGYPLSGQVFVKVRPSI